MPPSELARQIERYRQELFRTGASAHTITAYAADLAQFLEFLSPPETEPPPPPPPEEKVDLAEPEPEPQPSNDPPPGEQLGLDAEGAAGADGFGLAARPGGRDLLASGGSAYAWYAGLLKSEILDRLGRPIAACQGEVIRQIL